jgi:FixJ family two-component response regulator
MPRDLVCVVEDEDAVRRMLCLALAPLRVEVEAFAGADAFLQSRDAITNAGCVVANAVSDSGLDLQHILHSVGNRASMLFVAGPCDVSLAVRAMRAGAIDFLIRPIDPVLLRERVVEALAVHRAHLARRSRLQVLGEALSGLTPREREVLDRVVAGRQNSSIATDLGISMKTVEQHRARMMDKMRAASLADLVAKFTEWRLLSEAGRPAGSGIAGG